MQILLYYIKNIAKHFVRNDTAKFNNIQHLLFIVTCNDKIKTRIGCNFDKKCDFKILSAGVGDQGGHDEEDGELSGELQEEVCGDEAPTGTTVF